MDVQVQKKRMIAGGPLKLSEFQVRGYVRGVAVHKSWHLKHGLPVQIEVRRPTFVPMGRVETLRAISGLEAAKAYARSHGIPQAAWMPEKGAAPSHVIRVSAAGQRAP